MSAAEVRPGVLKQWLAIFPWLGLAAFFFGLFFLLAIAIEGSYKLERDKDFALTALFFCAIGAVFGAVSGPPITYRPQTVIFLRRSVLILANLLLAVITLLYCTLSRRQGPWV